MTVGPDTQVTWTLKAGEAAEMLGLLGTQPINRAGELHTRLRMQTEAQLTAPEVPPAPPPAPVPPPLVEVGHPLNLEHEGPEHYTAMRERAQRRLDSAETNRREPNGSIPTLKPTEGVDSDYAPAFSIIERALHHLNEGIPNRQLNRSRYAMSALQDGVWLAERWAESHLNDE